jgi:hypothetical protein
MPKAGDRILLYPLEDGKYAVIRDGPIKRGDRVIRVISKEGKRIAIKPSGAENGDRIIMIPTRSGDVAINYLGIVDVIPKGAIELRKSEKV